jgi:primosomal replication protein N
MTDGRNRAVGGGAVFKSDLSVLSWADTLDRATDPSGAIIQINLEHSKIHQGKGWEASIEIPSITSGANHYILFRVITAGAHLRSYSFTTSNGPVTLRMFEGPTVSTTGTEITPRNRNRSASDVNGVEVYTGATVSNDGTRLETALLPELGNKVGGNINSFYEEWILNQGDYVLKITNGSNSAINGVFNAFWYA